MPLGLIGKKIGHTRVYNADGVSTPVTVVQVGPNYVLQVKKQDSRDGYNAVQLGFDAQKESRLSKAVLGHVKKHNGTAVKRIKEFRDFSKEVKAGDVLGPDLFEVGQFVDCIGITKGRGFEGVVGRWSFAGGDMTHGAKGWHRRSGAIGCRLFPGHVNKGLKMPGHMGSVRRTSQNLEVVQVRKDDGVILIRGSFPGSEGDYCIVREAKKIANDSARLKQIHEHRAKLKAAVASAADKKAEKKASAPAKPKK
ncbi:MAG TPA: 50S ribosomal protein L3 [Verrucomicrobiales bacterium]|nr:50S ribosomal protein L3 [Verrucomicrobiales bacterium]